MTIHVTPIPSTIEFAAPGFTLTTANAAGSASTAVASNSDLLAFDATVPSNIATTTTSASAGVATVAPRRDHVHGSTAVIAAATEAEMVTASSTTLYASPGRTQYHPGVAKAHVSIASDGASYVADYNIASVHDLGTGNRHVHLTTAFADANWVPMACAGGENMPVARADPDSSSSISIYTYRWNGTTTEFFDLPTYFAAYGTQ